MTSILTNSSAMGALATLRSINSSMETTQERISSGLRVATAADNAAYWSIATTMRSDNKALSAVQDALGLGAAKTDVASSAMENSKDVVDEIKKKLVTASEPGVDKSKIQKEIKELQNQLLSIAKSASFSGENWVYTDPNNAAGTKSVVGSFNRDALDITSMTTGALSQALSGVDSVLTQMTDAAADLGALNSRIDLQKGFVDNLSDSIEKGVGRLVDADMNEESTRLKALQTQQQLGIQALTIANSNSQNILSLFR
ncbi:flagellin [Ensifer adhaerens]|uniref:flagellin N-terminal helical domain-containing protein n=1 Tax=Ensifer adhaerens TaxID=106592 RepID=UPI00098FA4AA|nr:flagellin [Ensifer adhaerens]